MSLTLGSLLDYYVDHLKITVTPAAPRLSEGHLSPFIDSEGLLNGPWPAKNSEKNTSRTSFRSRDLVLELAYKYKSSIMISLPRQIFRTTHGLCSS